MSNADLRSNLTSFLRGEITAEQVQQALGDRATIRMEGPAIRAIAFRAPVPEEIEVEPQDIVRMLSRYLEGEVDAGRLSTWASFITLSQLYYPPQDPEDEDHYEPMWHIIQQLSTPELDGALTPERARNHLRELERFIPRNK